MPCTCGHPIEEHAVGGACYWDGDGKMCECMEYVEDDDAMLLRTHRGGARARPEVSGFYGVYGTLTLRRRRTRRSATVHLHRLRGGGRR